MYLVTSKSIEFCSQLFAHTVAYLCQKKVLIFSQSTQMMDILEDYCCFRKHSYCRLDGSMKMVDRHDEVRLFSTRCQFVSNCC